MPPTTDVRAIARTLKRQRDALLGRTNVVATGIGFKVVNGRRTNQLAVICSVTKKVPMAKLPVADRVPEQLGEVPTDVIKTGPIRALARAKIPRPHALIDISRTHAHCGAPGGVSIAHAAVSAGTLGCLVLRSANGVSFILSNNHVLAASNRAQRGDAILQPGPADGGEADSIIARLESFVRIYFHTRQQARLNRVDAAIARPLAPRLVSPEILEVGPVAGVAAGELGMAIQKSGRTTGLTRGTISQIEVTADVEYGGGQVARFTDQLLSEIPSGPGDSGSAVLDEQRRVVGLLFAGSETVTLINRIEHVLTALRLQGPVRG
jgi:hypothetical protein